MPTQTATDLMRDLALDAERRLRSAVGRDRIRLAVTGLTRAGKTVFLTALVANLLAAGRGRHTLPAFELAAGGRLRGARLVPAGTQSVPRFDVHAHLAALAADPPMWPDRTEDLSTIELTLTLERSSTLGAALGGLLGAPRTITLELLDYPGEWLLDLPMLDQGFASWSAETLTRLRQPARLSATSPFLDFLDGLPARGAAAEEGLVRRGYQLYRDALRDCRDRLGLRFLQPGRALNPGPRGEAPILWFFPLPDPDPDRSPLAALLQRRHAAYVADQRASFFEPFFRNFRRQVVLADVLGALHGGEAAFADTAAALAAIGGALRPAAGGGWLDRLLGLGVERVAFVATKADHVPAAQRAALASLLGGLVGQGAADATLGLQAIASIRCTEDDVAMVDGRSVAAVRGVLLKEGRRARVWPGEVPTAMPSPDFWGHPSFEMPAFRPPRLDPDGQAGVPHLGLDRLLAYLIGDLL